MGIKIDGTLSLSISLSLGFFHSYVVYYRFFERVGDEDSSPFKRFLYNTNMSQIVAEVFWIWNSIFILKKWLNYEISDWFVKWKDILFQEALMHEGIAATVFWSYLIYSGKEIDNLGDDKLTNLTPKWNCYYVHGGAIIVLLCNLLLTQHKLWLSKLEEFGMLVLFCTLFPLNQLIHWYTYGSFIYEFQRITPAMIQFCMNCGILCAGTTENYIFRFIIGKTYQIRIPKTIKED